MSVLIPTLNAVRTLEPCLASVVTQDYPADRVQVIVADAGSTDGTGELARRFGALIVPNPLKTAEAGKAVALACATGDLVALIDSDNVLPDQDWLQRMVAPFADPAVVGAEPWAFTYRRQDPPVTRYCALMGMNDPLCYFLGNYDRWNLLDQRWTRLPVVTEERGDWLRLTLQRGPLPTMGANGFVIRRCALQELALDKYLFDIDVVGQLVERGQATFAKVKISIVHLYASSMAAFARKQRRRIDDYFYYQAAGLRSYPWAQVASDGIWRFALACLLVVPLLAQAAKGYARRADPAWALHPVLCWMTLAIYACGTVQGHWRPALADRRTWQQS